MTTRQITSGTTSNRARRLMALSIAGATALAVAAVAIGTWWDAQPRALTARSDAPIQAVPVGHRPDIGSTPSRPPIEAGYVLVSSEEDAAPLRELLASYSAPPPEGGQPLSIGVIVDWTNSFTADVALLLLPRSPIVDLRRPAAADPGL